MAQSLSVIVLAAGEGTRMRSQLPKVLHRLGGRTLIDWVLSATRQAGAAKQVAVLGHGADLISPTLPAGVKIALQNRRLGSGHAVLAARDFFKGDSGDCLIVCGDAPLILPQTLKRLAAAHRKSGAGATVLTAVVEQPYGYGRIVRETGHPLRVAKIVEEREASDAEKQIREVNSGAYCFSLPDLWRALANVKNQNRKGEYYLTDVIGFLNRAGRVVNRYCLTDPDEMIGVNTRRDLAQAARVLNRRILREWMNRGVTVMDPETTWVESTVRIGQDAILLPGTHLLGKTVVGEGCRIGPDSWLDSARVGRQTRIFYSVLEGCVLGDRVAVGPFSHLRSGTRIADGVHIGNFVEMNRTRVQAGVKAGHVSYLGDTQVGAKANIGAGTITANYDGKHKHPTRIGAGAFIGSGTVVVAPSTIGANALTGAGAVLKRGTRIPAGMVAVGIPARVIKKR